MQESAQYFEKRLFYKQVIGLSKFYATHRNYEICQNHYIVVDGVALIPTKGQTQFQSISINLETRRI